MDRIKQSAALALEATADAFETGKMTWAQKSFSEGTNACIMVGLDRISTVPNFRFEANEAIYRVLGVNGSCAVFKWNDEPGRTVGEVIDVLKQAAKDLRNEA